MHCSSRSRCGTMPICLCGQRGSHLASRRAILDPNCHPICTPSSSLPRPLHLPSTRVPLSYAHRPTVRPHRPSRDPHLITTGRAAAVENWNTAAVEVPAPAPPRPMAAGALARAGTGSRSIAVARPHVRPTREAAAATVTPSRERALMRTQAKKPRAQCTRRTSELQRCRAAAILKSYAKKSSFSQPMHLKLLLIRETQHGDTLTA